MPNQIAPLKLALIGCGFLSIVTSATLALARIAHAESMQVTGTMDGGVVQQLAHPLDAAGKAVVAAIAKGTSKSPGEPLDGAEFFVSENAVLDQGNGPAQGTVSFFNDKGSVTSEFHGHYKTVMVDGQPHISASGSYKMVAGTGLFAGGTGSGSYSTTFTSKTDFKTVYKGIMAVPKKTAGR